MTRYNPAEDHGIWSLEHRRTRIWHFRKRKTGDFMLYSSSAHFQAFARESRNIHEFKYLMVTCFNILCRLCMHPRLSPMPKASCFWGRQPRSSTGTWTMVASPSCGEGAASSAGNYPTLDLTSISIRSLVEVHLIPTDSSPQKKKKKKKKFSLQMKMSNS